MKKSTLFGTTLFGVAAFAGVLALSSTLNTAQAAPTVITTKQGKGADASFRGGRYAARTFGELDLLRVRNSSDISDARKTYLRFDLASLPTPAKSATGAALHLTIAPPEGRSPEDKAWTFRVFGLKDASIEENWDEAGVSWNNAPANVATSSFKLSEDAQELGTFTVTGAGTTGQTVSYSSPELLKFVQSDSNGMVTFILTRVERNEGAEDNVVHIFTSKEHATLAPPALVVAYNGEALTLPTAAQASASSANPSITAPKPETAKPFPFESAIAAFEAADRANPPAKGGVVFIGSSSIRRWNTLDKDFPEHNVINRGFGGSEIFHSAHFAQRIVTPYEPKMVVFYAGSNDINAKKSPERVLADYKAFVANVREKLPTTPIAFIAIAPSPSRWPQVENVKKANALIAEYSKAEPNLKFVDIFPLMLDENGKPRPELYVEDKLHMSPAGYDIWAKAVKPILPAP